MTESKQPPRKRLSTARLVLVVAALSAVAAAGATALLVNVMERKQEAQNPFYRVVALDDTTEDPEIWGKNFPMQYDGYRKTVDQVRTRFGGSEAVPRTPTSADPRAVVTQSKIEEDPRLKTMWAGYAISRDFPSWEERYGERFVLQRHTQEEWAEHDKHVGSDGEWLIVRLAGEGAPAEIKGLAEVQVLKTVWAQQFREAQGKIVYQAGSRYDGHTQIQTPHDPQARYSRKRVQEWVGGKVQVTETDDEGYPHLITDIAGTCSSKTDYESLAEIQERLKERHCLPKEQYVDSGYMSGPNLAVSLQNGIDLIGPTVPVVSPQSKIPDGITTEHFDIDIELLQATCPGGASVGPDFGWKGKIRFLFPKEVCAACQLRVRCCTGEGGHWKAQGDDRGYLAALEALEKRGRTSISGQFEYRGASEAIGHYLLFLVLQERGDAQDAARERAAALERNPRAYRLSLREAQLDFARAHQ